MWTENFNVYAGYPVHLSTGSVMKSALDNLIEELEAATWEAGMGVPGTETMYG